MQSIEPRGGLAWNEPARNSAAGAGSISPTRRPNSPTICIRPEITPEGEAATQAIGCLLSSSRIRSMIRSSARMFVACTASRK